jgi:hypothetical protein
MAVPFFFAHLRFFLLQSLTTPHTSALDTFDEANKNPLQNLYLQRRICLYFCGLVSGRVQGLSFASFS